VISTALVPGDTGGKIVDAIKEAIAAGANTVITAAVRDSRRTTRRPRRRAPTSNAIARLAEVGCAVPAKTT
jgi:hypothetical protein